MTRYLNVWKEAEFDVIDAVAWYEGQRVGLGTELLTELDVVFLRIAQTPLQFPEIRDSVHRALLHRFPYAVYFKADKETVDVIAVLHHHRQPNVWEQRIIK